MSVSKGIILIALLAFGPNGICQNQAETRLERLKKKLFSFIIYLKNSNSQKLNKRKILKKYVHAPNVYADTTKNRIIQNRFFNYFFKDLTLVLDTMNLEKWDVVSWNTYSYPQKLPKMLWEAEPVIELFGQPVDSKSNHEEEIREGKKMMERTLVIYKKTQPDVPVYYVLLDDKTDKITSWVLINQGGLHYWVVF